MTFVIVKKDKVRSLRMSHLTKELSYRDSILIWERLNSTWVNNIRYLLLTNYHSTGLKKGSKRIIQLSKLTLLQCGFIKWNLSYCYKKENAHLYNCVNWWSFMT